ncbi:MAG: rhodanese-like domain-containing protein [Aggregatilineales bacterium]
MKPLLQPRSLFVFVAVAIVAGGLAITWNTLSTAGQPISPAAQATVPAPVISNIAASEYVQRFTEGQVPHVLLDVRLPDEFASGHIAGSINIPVQVLAQHLEELPRDRPIVIYCRSGNRSAQAARILAEVGFTNLYDLGGIIDWTAAGYPIQ